MRRFLYLSISFGAGMLLSAGASLPTPSNLKPEASPRFARMYSIQSTATPNSVQPRC